MIEVRGGIFSDIITTNVLLIDPDSEIVKIGNKTKCAGYFGHPVGLCSCVLQI